jgi:hypothetical protein
MVTEAAGASGWKQSAQHGRRPGRLLAQVTHLIGGASTVVVAVFALTTDTRPRHFAGATERSLLFPIHNG